ncbi:hypothetical protein MXB_2204, partial [Myxobolus squamalis]
EITQQYVLQVKQESRRSEQFKRHASKYHELNDCPKYYKLVNMSHLIVVLSKIFNCQFPFEMIAKNSQIYLQDDLTGPIKKT